MKVGLDSSFIIHLLRSGTPQHQATWGCYQKLREAGATFVVSDHALLESFSVMSRSPAPTGLPPIEAEQVLREGCAGMEIAPTRTGLAWDTIRQTLSRGHWGGRVYDAVIALAVYEAGARLLLTWNVRHFHSVAPVGLEVREP
ncbi:MAG TPA: PIN domain-containing protein [Bryobacteraceae bacterium]|jgi:predicted nucleic acid-binding protein